MKHSIPLLLFFVIVFIGTNSKAQCPNIYNNFLYAPCPYELAILNNDTLHQLGTDYFYYKGDTIYNNGTFHDTLQSYLGCDSILIIDVFMAAAISYEHYDIPYCTNDSTTHLWLDDSNICWSKWVTEIKHSIKPKPYIYISNGYLYFGDSCKNRNFLSSGETYFYSCDSNKIVSSSWGEFLKDSIPVNLFYSAIFPAIPGNYSLVISNRGDITGPSYIGGGGTIYCDDTSACIYINFPVGINNQQNFTTKTNFIISPNPCTNELAIHISEKKIEKIEVVNILGQIQNCAIKPSNNSEIKLDVSKLNAQIYFLKLTDDKGLVHQTKFVKQ